MVLTLGALVYIVFPAISGLVSRHTPPDEQGLISGARVCACIFFFFLGHSQGDAFKLCVAIIQGLKDFLRPQRYQSHARRPHGFRQAP